MEVQQTSDVSGTATLVQDALGQVALQSRTPGDTTNVATWSLHDRLGSTVAQTTINGRITDLASYSDFGIPTFTSTGYASPTGYTGELTDATTGQNSYFSRTYDPFTATWLSADTYRGTLTNPQSQHRYGYVEGNPTTFVDAYGFRLSDPGAYAPLTKARAATSQQTIATSTCIRNSCVNTPSHHNDTSARHPPMCVGRGCQATAGPGVPLFTTNGVGNFLQNVGAGLAGQLAQLGVGVAGFAGAVQVASQIPACKLLMAACVLAAAGLGVLAAATVGSTVAAWISAGLAAGPRDSQEAALGMWLLGTAPNNTLTYGPNSVLAISLNRQIQIQDARDKALLSGSPQVIIYSASDNKLGNFARDACTYASWGTGCLGLGNRTLAGIGSFSGTATPVLGPDGSAVAIRFEVNNSISLRSGLGLVDATHPFLESIAPTSGPLSTVDQTITWTEMIR